MIKIIAATSNNGIIGIDNSLPWQYKEDMLLFKKKTTNSTVIMGRLTYESIGKPLKNRRNIVITKSSFKDVECYSSLEEAVMKFKDDDCWIIGGERMYSEGMKYAEEIHLTLVPRCINEVQYSNSGSNIRYAKFPWINPTKFNLVESRPFSEDPNIHSELWYLQYKRLNVGPNFV